MCRCTQGQLGRYDLPLRGLDFGFDSQSLRGVFVTRNMRLVCVLRGLRCTQRDRLGCVSPGCDFTNDLLDLDVLTDMRRVAVTIDTLSGTHFRCRYNLGCPRNTRERRQMKKLVERGLVAKAP